MSYLYLVREKDHSKFKIGYTIHPRARAKQYNTHSLDVEYIGHIEVPNKKWELYMHWELLKLNYSKCITQGRTEWFNGFMNYKEFYEILLKLKQKIKS